jgi:hypothetical protein
MSIKATPNRETSSNNIKNVIFPFHSPTAVNLANNNKGMSDAQMHRN